ETGPPDEQTRGFADIQGTASAQGNDTVTIVGSKCPRSLHDVLLERVRVNAEVKEPVPALLLFPKGLLEHFKSVRAEQPWIGHHQRPLDSQGIQPFGQFSQRARAEQRGRGKRKNGWTHHPLPGQNFTSSRCRRVNRQQWV